MDGWNRFFRDADSGVVAAVGAAIVVVSLIGAGASFHYQEQQFYANNPDVFQRKMEQEHERDMVRLRAKHKPFPGYSMNAEVKVPPKPKIAPPPWRPVRRPKLEPKHLEPKHLESKQLEPKHLESKQLEPKQGIAAWHKYKTKNFVIMSIDRATGQYLQENIEAVKKWICDENGLSSLSHIDFRTKCTICCAPTSEMMDKLFGVAWRKGGEYEKNKPTTIWLVVPIVKDMNLFFLQDCFYMNGALKRICNKEIAEHFHHFSLELEPQIKAQKAIEAIK